MPGPAPGKEQRIDQWLFFSRLVKSRTLAHALVERGKVRINRIRVDKASHAVKPGDVLTLSMGPRVRIIEVREIAERRGPATEAQLLFVEIESSVPSADPGQGGVPVRAAGAAAAPRPPPAVRERGTGRPTKRDRRAIDELKRRF